MRTWPKPQAAGTSTRARARLAPHLTRRLIAWCACWSIFWQGTAWALQPDDPPQPPNPPFLTFDQAPRIFSQQPDVFRQLLIEARKTATRIAFFGDSTATDFGGQGSEHMNWRRWLWHQYHGHTPGTQLSHSGNFGGSPAAEWLFMGGVNQPQPALVPSSFLPPGQQGAASFNVDAIGSSGLYLRLNHRNDNQQTMSCAWPIGFSYVPAAVGRGDPAFAAGSMQGGASLIDAAAGLRLEILAMTHPASAPSVQWQLLPQAAGDFCIADISAPVEQLGTLFGGAESLASPMGAAFRAQSDMLAELHDGQAFYMVRLTGSTTGGAEGGGGSPAGAVQIVGGRYVSENPTGLICDSLSFGGYHSASVLANHANCGPVLAAAGYNVAWIMYGLNDQIIPFTAAQYQANTRALIEFIRNAMGDAEFPIVLEACTHRINESAEAAMYAGALYQIAQDTDNVLFVNSRRLTSERFGWGTGSEESYLADPVHYKNLGAEAVSRCSVDSVIEYLTGQSPPLRFIRQPSAAHLKDTYITTGESEPDNGLSGELELGANADGSVVSRILLTFDELDAIPPGSTVTSAQVRLTLSMPAESAEPFVISRCTRPGWMEGADDGSGATWTSAGGKPPEAWTNAGGDYTTENQAVAALPDPSAFQPGDTVSYDVTPLAQAAVDGGQGALAVLMHRVIEGGGPPAVEAFARFFSSDLPVHVARPMLDLWYVPPASPLPSCPTDCAPPGGDGQVNFDDVLMVIMNWGAAGGPADVAPLPAGDGVVDFDDVLAVIMTWGVCP